MPQLKIDADLRSIAKGNVLSDEWSKKIYSVDASEYCLFPASIIQVKDNEDISNICKYAYSHNVSVTGRGAGTGLLGQSLTAGVCLDFTKYMNKMIEFENDYVIVEPGIVKAILDKELKKKGKFLPPDPASSNFCTIGGMIANNSSGIHALGYGNTIDFLDGIEIVYSNGSIDSIIDNSGRYLPHKIFTSSECTLGITTLAKFKILDLPLYRSVMVIGFENILKAIKVVPIILTFSPSALELLDSSILNYENMLYNKGSYKFNSNKSGTILFVEFDGDNLVNVELRLRLCREKLCAYGEIIEVTSDKVSSEKIWSARKSALNNVMKLTLGSRKPVSLIEDTVVNPEFLYEYTLFLLDVYKKYKLDYVFYGHAGNGNLHTRPIIDTASNSYKHLIKSLTDDVFSKVYEFSGSITAEHGDGISRTKYISKMYGPIIFDLFKKIKFIFDPTNIMNPGKKIIQ